MKIAATLLATAALAYLSPVPRDVAHVRCLELVAQDDFDRLEWVTRDGPRYDVIASTCHEVRFRRWMGVEWMADP